jgi:hypothetical protein
MKELVKKFLMDADYSSKDIEEGFNYADSVGYDCPNKLGQLTLSYMLIGEERIADGELMGWEPVNWSTLE